MPEATQRQIWKAEILERLGASAKTIAYSIDTAELLRNDKLQHNLDTIYRAIVCVVQYPEKIINVNVE